MRHILPFHNFVGCSTVLTFHFLNLFRYIFYGRSCDFFTVLRYFFHFRRETASRLTTRELDDHVLGDFHLGMDIHERERWKTLLPHRRSEICLQQTQSVPTAFARTRGDRYVAEILKIVVPYDSRCQNRTIVSSCVSFPRDRGQFPSTVTPTGLKNLIFSDADLELTAAKLQQKYSEDIGLNFISELRSSRCSFCVELQTMKTVLDVLKLFVDRFSHDIICA